jgi:hypothetical protein
VDVGLDQIDARVEGGAKSGDVVTGAVGHGEERSHGPP